jgi:hypothetical protein
MPELSSVASGEGIDMRQGTPEQTEGRQHASARRHSRQRKWPPSSTLRYGSPSGSPSRRKPSLSAKLGPRGGPGGNRTPRADSRASPHLVDELEERQLSSRPLSAPAMPTQHSA